MNTRHLLDPALLAPLAALPALELDARSLPEVRAIGDRMAAQLNAMLPRTPAIEVTERFIETGVGVRVYRPRAPAGVVRAALLWIHGGGYVVGSAFADDGYCRTLAEAVGCVIVSVDYRLAPESPHPGPVEDCHAALAWLHAHADELGVDRARIGIAGLSAGGGLCAALALLARDRGVVSLCFQAPMQPMLDDRTDDGHPTAGEFLWTAQKNRFGWRSLLGHEPGREAAPAPYAVPARHEDLAGLPPCFIGTGALDLFVEENLEYARRLMRAGVPVELHVYPGACHGFQMLAPQAAISQAYERDFVAALRRGLRVDEDRLPQPDPAPLIGHLKAVLPGIPAADVERFAASLAVAERYAPGEESLPREGVARGRLRAGSCPPGTLYPGVPHAYQVYEPARSEGPLALIVFMDGARYLGPEANAAAVLDGLIASGAIPPAVAVFVEPGAEGPGLPVYGGADNRSVEYDSPGDAYARFLADELLPHVTQDLTLSALPARRVIVGLSSGGHCALNAAFERPDLFGRVITHCGSFVNIRGGHELASKIRRQGCGVSAVQKVFMQTGEHDLDNVFGQWLAANRDMAAALAYRGIAHRLVVGSGGHSLAHGGALLPDTLRWIFDDETA